MYISFHFTALIFIIITMYRVHDFKLSIPLAALISLHYLGITFQSFLFFVWLRKTDEGSIPVMCI